MTFFLKKKNSYIERIHIYNRKKILEKNRNYCLGIKNTIKKKRKKKERLNKIKTPLPQQLFLNDQKTKKNA